MTSILERNSSGDVWGFDGFGLAYSVRRGQLFVHYPNPIKDGSSGRTTYGAGIPFDRAPEFAHNPDSERSQLWRAMLA